MATQPKTNRKQDAKVLIIGCGIAGTAAAICLKKAGIDSIIFEAYDAPGDGVGSFLGLTPNGQDVLKTLGIADAVLGEGFLTRGFHFSNNRKSFGTVPSNTITIKRGAITRELRAEVVRKGIPIHYGKRLANITQDEYGVTATFEDGTTATGAALIGCDGIHSQTRQVVFPDAPRPSYTGMISSGAVTKNTLGIPASSGAMEMVFGKNAFFSYLVRPDGLIYWFGNSSRKREPQRGELDKVPQDEWKFQMYQLYKNDNPIITQIIKATDEPIQKYPVYDIASTPNWHKNRVCLIGDAAHAPSPSAGQGASLALEDGIVIARCLRDIPNIDQAFSTFVALRKSRAEKLVKLSRRNGSGKAPANAFSRFVRDLLLPVFLKMGGDATKWMYSYHVEWNEKITNKEKTK